MLVKCPVCQTEYDLEPGKYKCECGAKFVVEGPDATAEVFEPSDDDPNKTIAPRHHADFDPADDKTMPGKRDRKPDGRFEPGDLIMGRYKVLAELGQGGMGVVYKCFDETAGIEIALKALPPELSHNTLEMEDIKENFQLVHNLHHPNIASSNTLEKDNANGNYYLIMECVEGEDLRRWIKRKRRENSLTLETVLPVIRQVAEALDYAHEQKIIHRDIKPGNIMIDQQGQVKVLDFGLAAQIHTSMTRVSMAYHGTSGTGPYMAPEQWRGRAQGAAADQYALAVMTYEMLAGHLPFESSDAAVLKQAVLDEEPEPLANVSRNVQTAVSRGMSKDPAERFSSCSEFVDALEGQKVGGANRKSGKGMWIALVAVIVLAVIGIGYGCHQSAKAQRIAEEQRIAAERRQKAEEKRLAEEQRITAERQRKAEEQRIAEEKRQKDQRIRAEQQAKRNAELAAARRARDKQDSASEVVPHSANASDIITISLSDNMKLQMVKVEKGSFEMSRVDGENDNDEKPHQAELTYDFYIGQTEVTQGQWKAVMGDNPSVFKNGANYPVENVSWYDAMKFCDRLNEMGKAPKGWRFTLPTETQWEYAARGGNRSCGYKYSGSNQLDNVAWYKRNSRKSTHPVAQKQANELGLYDMSGNVWEWGLDNYSEESNRAVPEFVRQSGDYSKRIIIRGGSWLIYARGCRSADRHNVAPDFRDFNLGFRLALVPISSNLPSHESSAMFTNESSSFPATIQLPNGTEIEMVKIKAGSFMMGSPENELGRHSDERLHRVTFTRDFWMGRYEITQRQWKAVMGNNPSHFRRGDSFPVEQVTWYDAKRFCDKLNRLYMGKLPAGYRFDLPTEEQWEYTCRAGTTTALNNGKNLTDKDYNCRNTDEVAWYNYRQRETSTHEVGRKTPNNWGLYDMHGNVWEWCRDWYDSPVNGTTGHVIRGGTWCGNADSCRSAHRFAFGSRNSTVGFRLALVPIQSNSSFHENSVRSANGSSVFPATIQLPNGTKLEMVKVKAGTFTMGGQDNESWQDERPLHQVTLTDDYWIGKYEVTQKQYMAVLGYLPAFHRGSDLPVENLTWYAAVDFCDKLNDLTQNQRPQGYKFSLPTEAQWEYAARGGQRSAGFKYSGSNDINEVSWFADNSGGRSQPVGQKTPNELGIFDMSGNVWEWCLDSKNAYSGSNVVDPVYNVKLLRVCRSGSWSNPSRHSRPSRRIYINPIDYKNDIGFRVALVRDVPQIQIRAAYQGGEEYFFTDDSPFLKFPRRCIPPYTIRLKCKCKVNRQEDFRLQLLNGEIIFNWQCGPHDLILDIPQISLPRKARRIKGKGFIGNDTWADIRVKVLPTRIAIYVNGQLRYNGSGNFKNLESTVGVNSSYGAVKEFSVEPGE